MKLAKLKRKPRGNPIMPMLAAGLLCVLGAPAVAGPIGAVGDVYVSDIDGIYQYDGLTGASVGLFASRGIREFNGQAWGPDGNLYAMDNGVIGRWSVDKFDGNTGALLGTVVNFNNTSVLSFGKGLTFGPDGDLYVGDWYQHRINRYEAGTFAPKASYVAVTGDGLGSPNGMTFAPNGNLLVISGGYNKVLQFDTSGNGVDLLGTFADLPGAQQAYDLTFGPNGNLFVTSGYTGGVMEFDGNSGAYISHFVANGDGGTALGLRFDNHDRLLLSIDSVNYGSRVVAYDGISGAPLGDFYPPGGGGAGEYGIPGYLSIKVPEPATISLLLIGGIALIRRRGVGG